MTALEVAAEEVNRPPTSAAACWFRPRRRASPLATDRPARALATIRNGKKHNSSVAAKSMPRLMKSIASSRRHRCSADEPAYFPLAASMPCRTRWPRPPSAAAPGDSPSWPADAIAYGLSAGANGADSAACPRCPGLPGSPPLAACRIDAASSVISPSSPQHGVSLVHPASPNRPGLPHQVREVGRSVRDLGPTPGLDPRLNGFPRYGNRHGSVGMFVWTDRCIVRVRPGAVGTTGPAD